MRFYLAQRITFTKGQLAADSGGLLYKLCLKVAEDGEISESEVHELKALIEESFDSDIPAFQFLKDLIEDILADGEVDDYERRELMKAVERVVPKSDRDIIQAKRKAIDERVKQERIDAASDSMAFDGESAPEIFDFMVAGTRYDDRPKVIQRYAKENVPVYFKRDYANKFSDFAVEVRLSNGKMIGYVPEHDAVDLAPILDGGCNCKAFVKKILYHADPPWPVIYAACGKGVAHGNGNGAFKTIIWVLIVMILLFVLFA